MESVLEELTGPMSYLTLGVLFFFVIWGFTQKIIRDIFPKSNIGWLLGLCLATYGFWYPFIPFMRTPYLIFLATVAVVGTGLSRASIVTKLAIRCNRAVVAVVIVALLSFEISQHVMLVFLKNSGLNMAAKVISWILLVCGITKIEIIGPVMRDMELPHASLIQAAFVLACVIFLPIELPVIYTLISVAAVFGTLLGWIYFGNTCQ